jgi:hypothetical protein
MRVRKELVIEPAKSWACLRRLRNSDWYQHPPTRGYATAVIVIKENPPPQVPPCHDVVKRPRILNTNTARHASQSLMKPAQLSRFAH